MNNIDIPALRRALRDVAAEIKPIKRMLRQPWDRPMSAEQRTLAALKRKATQLCVLRALTRGKHHLHDQSAEYHRDIAERAADRYRLILPGDESCRPS